MTSINKSETITKEDANREHRKFWAQPMEYANMGYDGKNWVIIDIFKTDKGSSEIQ